SGRRDLRRGARISLHVDRHAPADRGHRGAVRDGGGYFCASTTAIAAMLTTSLTSTPRCSTWTGLAIPCRIGPIASAPPRRQRSLYAAFAASRFGKTSTFASP